MDDKPKLTLRPLEGVVVVVPTLEEWRALTYIFECGGQTWPGGEKPTTEMKFRRGDQEVPVYERFGKDSYLTADGVVRYGSINDSWIQERKQNGNEPWSLDRYIMEQGISEQLGKEAE